MCQYSVFYGEYENEKKTGQKNLKFPFRWGFEPQIYVQVPAHNLNMRDIRSIELSDLSSQTSGLKKQQFDWFLRFGMMKEDSFKLVSSLVPFPILYCSERKLPLKVALQKIFLISFILEHLGFLRLDDWNRLRVSGKISQSKSNK